jgi:hypothetical protein
LEQRKRGFDGRRMDVDNVLDLFGVTARHDDRDGYPAIAKHLKHASIARGKTLLGERKPPQTIADIRIGASKIDREVRLRSRQHLRESEREDRQIFVVTGAVGELDV